MKAIFLFLLSLVPAATALAQSSYDLQGTIGNLPVYFHLEEYEGQTPDAPNVEARYFYQSSLKDVVMRGTRTGNKYILSVKEDERGYYEKCILTLDGAGKFTGAWVNRKGTSLPVSLKPLALFTINHPYMDNSYVQELRQKDTFNYVRSSFIKLKRDSVTSYKGKSFVWISETHCSMSMFRLGNGFSKRTLELINPRLDAIHFNEIISQLSCTSEWGYNTGTNIDYTTAITFLNEYLLGFSIYSYYDCGGAHPDGGSQGYLLDLHSGRQYSLDEVIAFHSSVTTEAKSGFEKFSAYREKYFAPQLLKIGNAIHRFKKPAGEDDCDYLDENVWKYPAWHFTEAGIEFVPGFPRVIRNCEEEFLVPFSALKAYRNPAFPYPFE